MKSFVATSSLLALAATVPQPFALAAGPLGGLLKCLGTCQNNFFAVNGCKQIDQLNACIAASSCTAVEKSETYRNLAQICADAGIPVTASPEATFHVTKDSFAGLLDSHAAETTDMPVPTGWGPFGSGGPGDGWGQWTSSGAWTSGPWTSWWGAAGCPESTWSGWTEGPWATDAPWTTWAGCTASTTATSVVTTTVTTGGSTSVVTSTGFGIKVAEATASSSTSSGSGSTTTSGSGAMATNFKFAGSAAGALGVFAGALLL